MIIPIWNGLPYLGACLDSLLRPEAPSTLEVIAVDNASGDGSASWIAEHYYMGTHTHTADLALVWPAWKAVHAQLGDFVEFQLAGLVDQAAPVWTRELSLRIVQPRPEEVEYPLFLLWLTSRLRWDIAFEPLTDTPFNRCKSDIEFLDYSAVGAAGVFTALPPYQQSVVHRETGWLCENSPAAWQEALCLLATDGALCTTPAHNAMQHLLTRRTLAQTAHQWTAAIDELLAGV